VGTYAVKALSEEAAKRGFDHVNVIFEPGESGPEQFFLHVGFEPVGETQYGETVAVRKL
jgi:diamine N-acetyltransferase